MIGWKVTARTLLVLSLVLLPGILSINPLYGVNFTSLSVTLLPSSINAGTGFTVSAILSGATATASGMVIYEVFAGGSCSGATSQFDLETVTGGIVTKSKTFTMSSPGTFGVNAIYFSTDTNDYGSTSLCKQVVVAKGATTTITTIFTVTGLSVTDTATFSPAAPTATGTVQYTLYFGGSCSGTYAQASQVSVGAGGTIPASTPFAITPGLYSLRASYSGDSAHAASTSPCETPVTVQATSSISTALSFTTIDVGKSVTDVATLGGVANGAAGSITFTLYTGSICSVTTVNTFTTSVINGVEKSAYTTPIFHTGGPYSIQAVYSGDSIDKGSTSGCTELLTVMASPTITTTLEFTTITLAGSVFDSATLTSATATAGGTVIYQLFPAGPILPGYSSGCAGLPEDTSQVTVSGGLVPRSDTGTKGGPFTGVADFPSPGTYFFNAVYSGDAFNHPATSGCETLTVTKASPAIATTILTTTPIAFGGTVTDSATLTNFGPTAGGTVTYNLYANGGCSGATVLQSDTEPVTNGVVTNSIPLTPNAPGSFSIKATYSGDLNNNGAASFPCESFKVLHTTTTVVNCVPSSVAVGAPSTCTATVTGSSPTGTVTFTAGTPGTGTVMFSSSTCTLVSGSCSVTATGATVGSGSATITGTYGGDGNNAGSFGTFSLTITKASTTTSVNCVPSSVSLSGVDSTVCTATVTGSSPTGTVTFTAGTPGTGTVTFTPPTTCTLSSGSCSVTATGATVGSGSVTITATYNGDSNNAGSSGTFSLTITT